MRDISYFMMNFLVYPSFQQFRSIDISRRGHYYDLDHCAFIGLFPVARPRGGVLLSLRGAAPHGQLAFFFRQGVGGT